MEAQNLLRLERAALVVVNACCTKQQFSVFEKIKDGDYRELDTVRGKRSYKCNIRYQSRGSGYITGSYVTVT